MISMLTLLVLQVVIQMLCKEMACIHGNFLLQTHPLGVQLLMTIISHVIPFLLLAKKNYVHIKRSK